MASSRDIVIVGAGVIGCAVAYELSRRGASVDVVDDRPAGMGATHAAAGVLAPFIEARAGGPLLELTARSLDLFDDFVDQVSAAGGLPVTYARTGTLDVALLEGSMSGHAATRELLAGRGIEAQLLDAQEVRALEPHLSSDAVGGLLIPKHGFVSALDLTRALMAAARQRGARFLEQGRARRIAQRGGGFLVDTDSGSLQGGAVVLAAGSWTGAIEIEGVAARVPLTPIRGQLLRLEWSGAPLRRVIWGERCYVVPWEDETVLVGATAEDVGFDERVTVGGVHDLIERVSALVPHARTVGFRSARAGLRPRSPDHVPIIGESAIMPRLVYATGHYRNGILLAPLTAQLVAGILLDRSGDPLLQLTLPQRFGEL